MVNKLDDNSQFTRDWTGNDRVYRNFLGRVRLNESPLHIRLHWKQDDNIATKQLIGIYRIDLKGLLKAGYIRNAPGYPGEVILRFQNSGGIIQIAVNRQGPALNIGTF